LSTPEERDAELLGDIELGTNEPDRNEVVLAGVTLKASGQGGSDRNNYANLDLLRSLAVLSVVATHFWQQSNPNLCIIQNLHPSQF